MSKVIGKECRFVIHIKEIPGKRPDTHLVKEILHYDNGDIKPNLRVITNFKRPFWITKPHFQNHKEKKESEDIEKLNKFYSTESRLPNEIAKKIGMVGYNRNAMYDIADNPYVYGASISAAALIKKAYMDKYGDKFNTPYSVASYDIETDIITDKVIISSISMKDKIVVAVLKDLVKNYKDPETAIRKKYEEGILKNEKILEQLEKYKMPLKDAKLEIIIVDKEWEVITKTIEYAHKWKPDFLAIWNMSYDIPKIIEVFDRHSIDIAKVFSDPTLPKYLRFFEYKEGAKKKVTESGKEIPINPHEQWHVTLCAASFYVIDAMSSYGFVRVGSKAVPGGYSLDNILDKEVELFKLKFGENFNYKGGEWHKFMVANKPIEYIVYNIWDTYSMLILDEKTKDLNTTLPLLAEISEFKIFNSGPKKITDDMFYFYLKEGKIIGTKPKTTDNDKILGLDGWIVTLPAFRMIDNGLKVIDGKPEITTNIRAMVFDNDAVSSYPSNTQAANVSKDTTERELITVEGIDKETFKMQNINLLSGPVNAIEYCQVMMNFPKANELLEMIIE